MPQRIETQLNTAPTAKGEVGVMETFVKTFINKIAAQHNDYLLELDAIGWQKILDPERINQDQTLIESKILIQRATEIVSKYRAKYNRLFENVPKEIADLNLRENSRQQMLKRFNGSYKQSSVKAAAT